MFARREGTWTQQTTLAPADGDEPPQFGFSVALADDGRTALVGAPEDDDPNGPGGAAYVFTRRGDTWGQQTQLTATDGDEGDEFGGAVALAADGSLALVGASAEEDPNGLAAGATYVFARADGTWVQQAKLTTADSKAGDSFGGSVTLTTDGSTALVGSPGADTTAENAGAAYVVAQSDETWAHQATLVPIDSDYDDRFGRGVALADDGPTALVSAPFGPTSTGTKEFTYVFVRTGGGWRQRATLLPPDSNENDGFGEAVALAADSSTALVGAPNDDDPNGLFAGAAYVFDL